ncbi:hypothetical protein WA538_000473 [Blastocystis sp. DL]
MNDHGIVELRGHLVNGVESGLFLEYENEKVVWIGYYQNGQRHMEVRNHIVKQDHSQGDGSGEFYELDENGKVTQLCLYVQGLKHRVIVRFNNDVMTEFDENEKRIYEGEYTGSVENGFMREGTGKEYAKGGKTAEYFGDWKNGKRNGTGTEYRGLRVLYIGEWKDGMKDGKGYERDGNGVMKRGCLFENGKMKRIVQEFNGGKMVEYDENGKKVYEGKWFGNMRSGFFSHERMEGMSGYFKEVDSSGQLISVSEYNELNV